MFQLKKYWLILPRYKREGLMALADSKHFSDLSHAEGPLAKNAAELSPEERGYKAFPVIKLIFEFFFIIFFCENIFVFVCKIF